MTIAHLKLRYRNRSGLPGEQIGVRASDLESALAEVAVLEETIARLELSARTCTCAPDFDLIAHQQVLSRANPMAAAFAVNARKGD